MTRNQRERAVVWGCVLAIILTELAVLLLVADRWVVQ
jgi:predicted tellurium resistance membrane protein TerC